MYALTNTQWDSIAIILSYVIPFVIGIYIHSPRGSKLSADNVRLLASITPGNIMDVVKCAQSIGNAEDRTEAASEIIQRLARKYGQTNKSYAEASSLANYLIAEYSKGNILQVKQEGDAK